MDLWLPVAMNSAVVAAVTGAAEACAADPSLLYCIRCKTE